MVGQEGIIGDFRFVVFVSGSLPGKARYLELEKRAGRKKSYNEKIYGALRID